MPTPQGDARLVAYAATGPGATPWVTVVLSHGAGGGLGAADLVAAATVLPPLGVEVWLVEQPWRLAGRRVAASPSGLDEGFRAVVERSAPSAPFVVGGRSAGARVGCRTGVVLGAAGVLALAFPLHPPGRPDRSRADELTGARLPVAVVQGDRDAFGSPAEIRAALDPASAATTVVEVGGADHGFGVLRGDGGAATRDARLASALGDVACWLRTVVAGAGGTQSPGNT